MNNRRKPRVVIPRRIDALVAVAENVNTQLNSILDDGSPFAPVNDARMSALALQLDGVPAYPDGIQNAVVDRGTGARIASETAQARLTSRDEACNAVRDGLIQIRDSLLADSGGDFTSVGQFGFQVVQYKVRGRQKPRVVIPTNCDSVLALARRVNFAMGENQPSAETSALFAQLNIMDRVSEAQNEGRHAVNSREESQRLTELRDRAVADLRDVLGRIRDVAFAIAGPRNYESVSQVGFEVQSTATQNSGSSGGGSGVSDGPPEETKSLDALVNQLLGVSAEDVGLVEAQVTLSGWFDAANNSAGIQSQGPPEDVDIQTAWDDTP